MCIAMIADPETAHDLNLFPRRFVFCCNLVPGVLLQERCQDLSHLIAVWTSGIDDSRDTSDHGTVEHLELTSNRKEPEIRHLSLELLPDLKVELCCLETRRSRCSVSIRR